jgi:hypothetical protein
MSTNFPRQIDSFTELDEKEILNARIANNYADAVIACQTKLSSLYTKTLAASKTLFGAIFQYQFDSKPLTNKYGHLDSNEAQKRKKSNVHVAYGSTIPADHHVTLDLSAVPNGKFPNSQLFHASNMHFVTLECAQNAQVVDAGWDIWELQSANKDKCGGPYLREGTLWYDGATDKTPTVVVADFTPYTVNSNAVGPDFIVFGNSFNVTTRYTVFIHLVVIG